MDSETRKMMLDSAGTLLSELSTREVINEAEKGVWPKALWEAAYGAGMTLVAVPEAAGGVGGTVADLAAVARLCGYHAAPVPIVETAMAAYALASAGLEIPEGPLAMAINAPEGQPLLDAGPSRVNGTARRVYWARDAKAVLFGAVGDGQSRMALIVPDQLSIERGQSAAGEPCDAVTAKAVPVAAGRSGTTSVDLWRLGALMRTAQLAGAAERALHIAVDYARERKQFGRPIGKFQAVQQLLAELAGQSAATGAAAEMAAAAEEQGRDKMALAAAKTRASEAAGRISAMAHQTLGAMGFTYEHHLHQFTRRLWVWRDDYGSDAWWARRLGRAITQAGAPALWKSLTDGASLGPV